MLDLDLAESDSELTFVGDKNLAEGKDIERAFRWIVIMEKFAMIVRLRSEPSDILTDWK